MRLKDFVNGFPGVRIASEEDNRKILDFYNTIGLQGPNYHFKFQRDPDFFRFLNYYSNNNFAFIVEDEKKEMIGLVSLSVRLCYINKKKDYVGYISDVRMRKDTRTRFRWWEFVNELCHNGRSIIDLNGCQYYLFAMLDTKYDKKNAPGRIRRAPHGLSPVSHYQMITTVGRKLSKYYLKKKSSMSSLKIEISRGNDSIFTELSEFLDKQNIERTFGFIFNGKENELLRRFNVWNDFSITDFFIARNNEGQIIGCSAPWDPGKGRRIVIDKFPKHLEFLSKTAAKPFGRKVAIAGKPLDILCLTHLELAHSLDIDQKRHVFNEMLDSFYSTGVVKNFHLFAFCDYNSESILPGFDKDYVFQKTPSVLYQFYTTKSGIIFKEENMRCHIGNEICLN